MATARSRLISLSSGACLSCNFSFLSRSRWQEFSFVMGDFMTAGIIIICLSLRPARNNLVPLYPAVRLSSPLAIPSLPRPVAAGLNVCKWDVHAILERGRGDFSLVYPVLPGFLILRICRLCSLVIGCGPICMGKYGRGYFPPFQVDKEEKY